MIAISVAPKVGLLNRYRLEAEEAEIVEDTLTSAKISRRPLQQNQ